MSLRELKVYFHRPEGVVRAVDGVSFEIERGETLALVGESGCGKTVTALSILRLLATPPARIEGGSLEFEGRDLLGCSSGAMRRLRGDRISMVFQDPSTALNPVRSVGHQIREALRAHRPIGRAAARKQAVVLLKRVGIPMAESRAEAFPHQLSGGMRQRVVLAMALACKPALLIADEPTTALDLTVQAQIIELIRELKAELAMATLLITHDMGVVAELADRVAVMYAGKIVELGPVEAVFDEPRHPYTAGLFLSRPRGQSPHAVLRAIPGEAPDPLAFPRGCRFRPRCPLAIPACGDGAPPLAQVGRAHASACIRLEGGKLPPLGWRP